MVRKTILILLVFSAFAACGQHIRPCQASITGLVQNTDGEVMPGANVRAQISGTNTVTDTSGNFSFDSLCEGDVTLSISHVGYEVARVTIKLPTDQRLLITLIPSIKVLHDFVFEEDHSMQHFRSQSIDILSGDDMLLHKGKSLGEMAQQLSGVSGLSSGPANYKPVIHGLHGQRILILNNGVKQEGQQWGVEHAPEIDPNIASDVEVVKGAETVRYGADAIGGVIIVRAPKLLYGEKLNGEISQQLNSNSRMLGFSGALQGAFGANHPMAWRVQGSGKRGGDFNTPDYVMSNTGFRELNASGAIGHRGKGHTLDFFISTFNTEVGILRSSHTGSMSDLESSIRYKRPWYIRDFTYNIGNPRQKISHHLSRFSFRKNLSDATTLTLQYATQFNRRREYDVRRKVSTDKPSLSLELFSHNFDAAIDKEFSKWKVSAGVNGAFRNNNNVLSTGILPDYRLASAAFFVIGKRSWQNWAFEWGARSEYQYLQVLTFDVNDKLIKPEYQFLITSLSMGSEIPMGSRSSLSSHVSFSSRPPHTSELFSAGLHHSAGAVEEGLLVRQGELRTSQENAEQEKSFKWISSYQFHSRHFSLEVAGHLNLMRDYIFLSPQGTRLTIRGFFPVFEYQQTDALFTGGEATVSITLSPTIKSKTSGGFLYVKDVSNDDRLPMVPPGRMEQSLTYTLPDFTYCKNSFVRMNIPFVFRQHHAPRTVYPTDVVDGEGRNFDFMEAPASYVLVNIYIGTDMTRGDQHLSLVAGCENVLGEKYRSYMNRLRYFADEPGRNFSVRFHYNF